MFSNISLIMLLLKREGSKIKKKGSIGDMTEFFFKRFQNENNHMLYGLKNYSWLKTM